MDALFKINMVHVVLGALGASLALVLFISFVKSLLKICAPNEAIVVTGRKQRTPDGRERGSKVTMAGREWIIPLLNEMARVPLSLMEVPISVHNAYSKGGIAMNVEAIANVKVSSDETTIHNAVERFLGRETIEIRRVSKETLEGHLRSVIANLTPEQVNEDRLRFAEELTRESEQDLKKLGLHLDTFKISHVSDEVGYLDATGRKAIANIVRAAEIAESDAKRAAEQSESQNAGRANVRRAEADAAIAKMRNELRKIKADLESHVKSEEERTAAAAREARARAEQHLQKVRAELEGIRLQADKVLPADADRQAKEYLARGQAAEIRERGRAVSEALDALYRAWQQAGPAALQISIIEDIEAIMESAVRGVRKIDVKSLSVIDGGDGRTLSNYIGSYPAMLKQVFAAVDGTVGIDIPGALSGKEEKK